MDNSRSPAPRLPGYLLLEDADGLRHVVRVSSIQLMSDADPCQDTAIAVVAGRPLSLPIPLDELLNRVTDCEFWGKAPKFV